jgi:hypothetical protein
MLTLLMAKRYVGGGLHVRVARESRTAIGRFLRRCYSFIGTGKKSTDRETDSEADRANLLGKRVEFDVMIVQDWWPPPRHKCNVNEAQGKQYPRATILAPPSETKPRRWKLGIQVTR